MTHIPITRSKVVRFIGLIVVAIFGIISTLGTGGGGTGSAVDDGGGVTPVTYTGLTTQALITRDNALLFGEVALLGVATSGTVEPMSVIQSTPLAENRNASIIAIARVLHTVMKDVEVNSAINTMPIGWVETQPPISGDCSSGTFSGSIEIDESTQSFEGTLVFDNFCHSGITMDGSIDVQGSCDPLTFSESTQTCDPMDYVMSFNNLCTSGYGESQTLKGTMQTRIFSPTEYMTSLSLQVRDDNTNTTYQFEVYTIDVVTHSTGYDSVRASGKVYHPDYGFVVVAIPTPLIFPTDMLDTPPLFGVAYLTGAYTSGEPKYPTYATFTFFDTPAFICEIDTDGIGGPDVTWSCDWGGTCYPI